MIIINTKKNLFGASYIAFVNEFFTITLFSKYNEKLNYIFIRTTNCDEDVDNFMQMCALSMNDKIDTLICCGYEIVFKEIDLCNFHNTNLQLTSPSLNVVLNYNYSEFKEKILLL